MKRKNDPRTEESIVITQLTYGLKLHHGQLYNINDYLIYFLFFPVASRPPAAVLLCYYVITSNSDDRESLVSR